MNYGILLRHINSTGNPRIKKSLVQSLNELKYIFDVLCCYRGCRFYTVHKITGYFHKCYFTLI